MTAPQSPRKRVYSPHQNHGHHLLKKTIDNLSQQDKWLDSLGDVGEAVKVWQDSIIHDLGGGQNISAMQRSIVELAAKTHLLLAGIDQWLLKQPSLINKRKRQLFPIVQQRQALADSLSRYMSTLGLEKKVKQAPNIQDYLEGKKAS